MENVISLPRPRAARPEQKPFGFFVRVGRNDHKEILDLIASGERGIFGFVIDAQNADRHRELIVDARHKGFDVILDPKTQQMGFVGSHTERLAGLPWGSERPHNIADFEGAPGKQRAKQIVEFTIAKGFTQILGPTHVLNGPNDPWLRRDIRMMGWMADEISRAGMPISLVYSLAMPIGVMRNRDERSAIVHAVEDAPFDALWLKIEKFGDDATGDKTTAYIDACQDFHQRDVPVVGDHLGGLPGLGAIASGAIGGLAHGVTLHQSFNAASWRRPSEGRRQSPPHRVYFPQLDMLMKKDSAKALLDSSARIRGRCGCKDTHCCPHGVSDMLSKPARHALYQQARELEKLASVPQSVRVSHYLDEHVRKVSDSVAAIAAASSLTPELKKALAVKQARVSRFRQVVAHLAESAEPTSVAMKPVRRVVDDRGR